MKNSTMNVKSIRCRNVIVSSRVRTASQLYLFIVFVLHANNASSVSNNLNTVSAFISSSLS
jgi:hypothetical protein